MCSGKMDTRLSHFLFFDSPKKRERNYDFSKIEPLYRLLPAGTFLLQEPAIELGIIVCFGPGIMFSIRINGKLDVTLSLLQGINHRYRSAKRNAAVKCAMKNPSGNMTNPRNLISPPASTDRCYGRKSVGIRNRKGPGTVTTHTEASEIYSIFIDSISGHDLIQPHPTGHGIPMRDGFQSRVVNSGPII